MKRNIGNSDNTIEPAIQNADARRSIGHPTSKREMAEEGYACLDYASDQEIERKGLAPEPTPWSGRY